MSANLISLPFRPALNLSGTFESGARLTVYRAGSTTLEPIFADSSLTVRLPNPVTADGFGVFPAIYYNEQSTVRVLLEQSDGTALFDLSPYISTVFEAENILGGAAQEAFNAASEAARAKASADAAALVEGTVEALVGPTYPSTSDGLAATSSFDSSFPIFSSSLSSFESVSYFSVSTFLRITSSSLLSIYFLPSQDLSFFITNPYHSIHLLNA